MTRSITEKLLDVGEQCLNDDRFEPVGFAFRTSHWSSNAQTRLFHTAAAYITMMGEYYKSGTVPRDLVAVGRACVDLQVVLKNHFTTQEAGKWEEQKLPGMEWTSV